jgi:hypothetical protein
MLDLLDILFLSFIGWGSPGWARSEDPADRAAGAVGMLVLPALAFCIVLFGGVVDPMLVLFGIPAACVLIVIGLCVALRVAGIATVRIALCTSISSFLACGTAWLMAVFAAVFRGF